MKVIFTKEAQKEYLAWEKSNPKINDKIVELISDILKNGFLVGIGKPEQLRHYKNPPPIFTAYQSGRPSGLLTNKR